MQAAKLSTRMVVCALLPWSVLAGRTDQYTFRTIDYPGADFTAGFTISSTGDIGGLTCIGASCQGFLLRHGTEFVLITPPAAAGSLSLAFRGVGFW